MVLKLYETDNTKTGNNTKWYRKDNDGFYIKSTKTNKYMTTYKGQGCNRKGKSNKMGLYRHVARIECQRWNIETK